MKLGWIDFSKKERSNVKDLLDSLKEKAVKDELGISAIRDYFSELFFPGITIAETRAKYFCYVAYLLSDMKANNLLTENELYKKEYQLCGELINKFSNVSNYYGIIGVNTYKENQKENITKKEPKWVIRTPAEIYWNGMQKYQIIKAENILINDFLTITKTINNTKAQNKSLGSGYKEENDYKDDYDANNINSSQLLNIPTYEKDWKKHLSLELTSEEARFLKEQIIENCPNTLLSYILDNNKIDFVNNDLEFHEIDSKNLPDGIREDFILAAAFSEFMNLIYIRYNTIIYGNNNQKVKDKWSNASNNYQLSALDLDKIEIKVGKNYKLFKFLKNAKICLLNNDLEKLDNLIIERERSIKGSQRAKTSNIDTYKLSNSWFCGDYLHYRFQTAKTIIKDILKGVNSDVCE